MLNKTIFECRCCGRFTCGFDDGTFDVDEGGVWRRIARIDGPNAICPACQADPEALDFLIEDGYTSAHIIY